MSSLPQRRESPRVPPPRPSCFSPWLWAWWWIELGTIGLYAGYLAGAGYWAAFVVTAAFGVYWVKKGVPQ